MMMYITVMVNISLYSMLGDASFSSIQEDCVHMYTIHYIHTYVRVVCSVVFNMVS